MQVLFAIVLSYLTYALVTAYTPGPNNIVALYAVGSNGWKKGREVLCGIAAGFLCVMVVCSVFCYELAQYIPSVTGFLKYVGAAYIVYLAVHVAMSKPEAGEGGKISFWNGFFLQFVNVKIILFAITTFTGYVLPHEVNFLSMLFHAFCVTVVGVSGTIVWAAAGSVFQRFLAKYYRPFNCLMAIVLLYCAVTLVIG